jgi:hypothetical protein
MPDLPQGTMIVYTSQLYMGLICTGAAGALIGIVALGWFTEWRCPWCRLRAADKRAVEEAGRGRGIGTTT